MDVFRVEEIQETDLKAVIRLAWKTLPAPLSAPFLMNVARRESGHFRVVREAETGTVRGFVVAASLPVADERVLLLAIDPEFQHQGLRRALLRQLQETRKKEGERAVAVDVPRLDDDTMTFFHREGYVVVGVEGTSATLAKSLVDGTPLTMGQPLARPTVSPKT